MREEKVKFNNLEVTYGPCLVECSCGNQFETRSTTSHIKVEICSACHPFYTGKQKLVDTAGRVEKFQAKIKAAQKYQEEKNKKNQKTSLKENSSEKE